MSFSIKSTTFIICFFSLSLSAFGQKALYERQIKQIQAQAKGSVERLKLLLIFISDEEQSGSVETGEAIENSFNDPAIKFFTNQSFRVYSDEKPDMYDKDHSYLVPVKQYLTNFDLYYKKNKNAGSPTIIFNYLKVSKLRWDTDSTYYLNVFFTSLFKNKCTDDTINAYRTTNRVAQIRIKRVGRNENVWTANIERLDFFEPKDMVDVVHANDVVIKKDVHRPTPSPKPPGDTTKIIVDTTMMRVYFQKLVEEPNRVKRLSRDSSIAIGDSLIKTGIRLRDTGYQLKNNKYLTEAKYKFSEAKDNYQKATDINPDHANKVAKSKLNATENIVKSMSRDSLVSMGDTIKKGGYKLRNNKKLTEARDQFIVARYNYQKAENINPDTIYTIAKFKLVEIEKIIDSTKTIIDKFNAENSYQTFKSKGDQAKDVRRFVLAIDFYKKAIAQKQEAHETLGKEIDSLNNYLDIISLPQSKLASGAIQDAIDECESLLRQYRRERPDYPEFYYIEGGAYDKSISYDLQARDKALDNYSSAIQYAPNYMDVRLARASLFTKYRTYFKDADARAISDFEVIIRNTADDSPDKPGYLVSKARLEEMVQNLDGALKDYNNAIELSPQTDSLYLCKGEFLYNSELYSDAKTCFDLAIKLNKEYKLAHYYRGLSFVVLHNYDSAGADFDEVEKLGIQPDQRQMIDSLSDILYVKGDSLLNAHYFANADTAYNNALKLWHCNYKALSGKAQIHFMEGDRSKPDDAKVSYQKSIDLNKEAIKCNPGFSDAHFREGMAHTKIGENDLAIGCFNEAIRNNPIYTQAYIERGNTFQTLNAYANAINSYTWAINLLSNELTVAKKGGNKASIANITNELSRVEQLNGKSYYLSIERDDVNATNSLNTSIQYNEKNAEAFYYRGLVNEDRKELSSAIKDFNTALKLSPLFKYYYANGTANLENKNYNDAIINFTGSIKLGTSGASGNKDSLNRAFYLRGICYFGKRMFADAIDDFSTFNKRDPSNTDPGFYLEFGLAQLYINRNSDAKINILMALKLSPNDPEALFTLGCAYAMESNFKQALIQIQQSLATHAIPKDKVRSLEEAFLDGLNHDRPSRDTYARLKRTYLTN